MKLSDLILVEPVQTVARDLAMVFPDVFFSSGRRTLEQQAYAMADNVVVNRKWIAQTYVASLASAACQACVDANPTEMKVSKIVELLLGVLKAFPEDQLIHLSRHLSGRAFDVDPVDGAKGENIKAWLHMRAAQVGGKFLEREGGLRRWHFEA